MASLGPFLRLVHLSCLTWWLAEELTYYVFGVLSFVAMEKMYEYDGGAVPESPPPPPSQLLSSPRRPVVNIVGAVAVVVVAFVVIALATGTVAAAIVADAVSVTLAVGTALFVATIVGGT